MASIKICPTRVLLVLVVYQKLTNLDNIFSEETLVEKPSAILIQDRLLPWMGLLPKQLEV